MTFEKLVTAWTKRTARDWHGYADAIAKLATAPDPIAAARRLTAATPTAVALAEPETLAGVADSLAALVDLVARTQDAKRPKTLPASTIELLDVANAVACVGGTVAKATTDTFVRWLPDIGVTRNHEIQSWYWNTGFAAVALGDGATYRRFAGVNGTGPLAFEPGATHGFNLQAAIRYFAAAIEAKAPASAVEPAWREIVDDFETQESASRVDGATLLWIARVVHHRIGGHPLASVAKRLHDEVW